MLQLLIATGRLSPVVQLLDEQAPAQQPGQSAQQLQQQQRLAVDCIRKVRPGPAGPLGGPACSDGWSITCPATSAQV